MTGLPRVAVLDDYQHVAAGLADWGSLPAVVDLLHEPLPRDAAALAARLEPYDVLVAMRERTAFPREVLALLPRLRLLVTTGMRNAVIDLDAARDHGVVVCGTGSLAPPTAELTWGLVLALARHIPAEREALAAGRWQTTVGTDLSGRVLGLLGLGRLGGRVARVGLALDMDVVAWSEHLTDARCAEVGVRRAASKDELLAAADVVSLHLVLSERTRGLLGARELALLRPGALLVNTSRAGLVDTAALVEAVRSGRLGGVALDVHDEEPLPLDSPLRDTDRVLLTPHLGYVTQDTYRLFYAEAVEDVGAFLAGAPVRVLS